MRYLALALALLLPVPASAVTQTTKQGRLTYALTQSGMPSSQAALFLAGVANVLYYDTYAELAAASPTEGLIGYAIDTNAFYLRVGGTGWVAINTTTSFTGAQGGTLDNAVDTVWKFTEGATAEDLRFTATSNLWTISSSTSATVAFTPAVGFTGDATLSGGAGALTFDAASSSVVVPNNSATGLILGSSGLTNLLTLDTRTNVEKLMITGTTTATALHVDKGTALFDEAVTIGAGAGALTFTDSAAALLLNDNDSSALDIGASGATSILRIGTLNTGGSVTVTGTAGQTSFSVPVGESSFVEGIDAPIVASARDVMRTCGNGANGNTANYMKPILETDYATDMTYGATACDAADSTTITTADLAWNSPYAYKPVAMVCVITGAAAGNDDVVTFQLYDDAAAVSGMTCTVTMAGTAVKQCSVRDPSPTTVAAASQMTVGSVAVDDDLSTADVDCRVSVNY